MGNSTGVRTRPARWVMFWAACVGGTPVPLAGGLSGSEYGSAARLLHGPGITNHPLDVTIPPDMTVPDAWPLAKDGTLTCLTCHHTLPPADGSSSYNLRDWDDKAPGNARAFCSRCHTEQAQDSASGAHWMALQVAHVRKTSDKRVGRGGRTDSESRRCLGCHDGVTATDAGGGYGQGRRRAIGAGAKDHPVGVVYGRQRPGEGPPAKLRHQASLPKQVRLPEGKVSCVSCHDLYSPEPGRLTVTNKGSALCFTCHAMD